MITPEAFEHYARWHAEQQIDDLIANEPDPRDRAMLALHRERIIDKLTDLAVIADLRRRLAEAEQARLRLVS